MRKMTRPTVDVVRFQESDVIVASGGIMNVTGLGNGETATGEGDGLWQFGTANYYSSDINGNPNRFVEEFNAYFGTSISGTSGIRMGATDLDTLVWNDMQDSSENPSHDGAYNGSWRWNGSIFVKQ